uniref:Immunoglobulin V-set domain-containing protein n=1 Tax=Sexangularia sp. CB-2014 TaxID=1486929 RepID=A0A7S1YDN1_9EUKA|mmetsp:Transcript_15194/g.47423  ORF Transcript_15194/g.47423 Transcript_15194/m.47423 type:complete len:147 (+) Transcript_15194:178-618(+)
MFVHLLLLLPLVLSITPSQQAFQVRPHVPDSISITSEGVTKRKQITCTFSHDSAGGTGENWEISMDDDGSGGVIVTAGRPSSYLLFSSWSLVCTAPKGHTILAHEVLNGDGPVSPTAYLVDSLSIRPTEHWSSVQTLQKLVVQIGK